MLLYINQIHVHVIKLEYWASFGYCLPLHSNISGGAFVHVFVFFQIDRLNFVSGFEDQQSSEEAEI